MYKFPSFVTRTSSEIVCLSPKYRFAWCSRVRTPHFCPYRDIFRRRRDHHGPQGNIVIASFRPLPMCGAGLTPQLLLFVCSTDHRSAVQSKGLCD